MAEVITNNFQDNTNLAVIDELTKKYSYVAYIDLEKKQIIRYRAEDFVVDLIEKYSNIHENDISRNTDIIHSIMWSIVPVEDLEKVREEASFENIEKALEEKGEFYYEFRVILDKQLSYYRMRVSKIEGNEHGRFISFISIDVTQRLREQTENTEAVLLAMTEEYGTLMQVNLETKEVRHFRMAPEMKKKLDEIWGDKTPSTSSNAFAENFVIPEDRNYYKEQMNEEAIRKALKENSPLIVRYRMNPSGTPEWFESRVIHTENTPDNVVLIGIRSVDAEVRVEAERQAKIKNHELMEEINALSTDYLAIITADLETDEATTKYMSGAVETTMETVNPDATDHEPYSERMQHMAETLVVPEDRDYFIKNTTAQAVINGLQNNVTYGVQYRMADPINENAVSHMMIKYAKNPQTECGVVIGILDLEEEFRERTKAEQKDEERRRVVEILAGDFTCVNYVKFTDDPGDDMVVNYRVSEEMEEIVPGWNEEKYMCNKLELASKFAVYAPDRARFIEETRRARVIEILERDSVCFVNVRMLVRRKIKYYQLKFTADRDEKTGKIIGYILGLHNTDEETRQELKREAELQEATANAERMILTRTSELKERNLELARMNDEVVELLGDVIELRDEDSGEHVRRVKAFTHLIAKQVSEMFPKYGLTSDDVEYITSAAALHDIGKILISDSILLKPGKLTDEEFEIMKSHTVKGCEVLEMAPKSWNARFVKISKDICRSHHEKWDGKGYPDGLKGDEIPLAAQIVAIADCFDALTSKRVYKDAFAPEVAYNMIINGECGEFSEDMMAALESCKSDFIGAGDNLEEVFKEGTISVYGMDKLKGTRILLVDDDDLSLDINEEILESEGAVVVTASNGVEAIEKYETEDPFDVIIMDVIMPVMDGIEATRRIRESEIGHSIQVPIIGLTAEGNSSNTQALMNAGVSACMAKPLVVGELTRILLSGIKERVETMEKVLEDTIRIANTDALTKVKNVTAYTDMINDLTEEIRGGDPPEFAVVVCDINNLKHVNDNFGHDMGDIYIKNCCNLICEVFDHSPVYRTGGDEFAVILQGRDYESCAAKMVELKEKVEKTRAIPGVEDGRADFGAGIAVYDPDTDFTVGEVVKRADSEMYKDKRAMKGIRG